MGRYFDEMKRTMEWLATQQDTMFLGQAVGCAGTFLAATVADVPAERRLEVPVCEQMQMQMSIGMALDGMVPISIFPRQNFLLLATAELVNMLDKIPVMSDNKMIPPVIIRTAAGTTRPIHPGHQHVGHFVDAFKAMFTTIRVVELHEPEDIFPAYQKAYEDRVPTLLLEFGDHYGEK